MECPIEAESTVTFANSAAFDLAATGGTIEAWARQLVGDEEFAFLIDRAEGGQPAEGYSMLFPQEAGSERKFRFNFRAGIVSSDGIAVEIPADEIGNDWHHFVAVTQAASTSTELYFDGAYRATESGFGPLIDLDFDLKICGSQSATNDFGLGGFVDEVRISPEGRAPGFVAVQHLSETDTSWLMANRSFENDGVT